MNRAFADGRIYNIRKAVLENGEEHYKLDLDNREAGKIIVFLERGLCDERDIKFKEGSEVLFSGELFLYEGKIFLTASSVAFKKGGTV